MLQKIPFTKMHGLGNDYIYVNTMEHPLAHPSACAVEWSDRHTGIGSDGLVLIGGSQVADFSMRIFNADGTEAMMCGNASRCIGKYVYDKGLTSKTEVTLETLSGIKTLRLHVVVGRVETVTVDMGTPLLANTSQVSTETGALGGECFDVEGVSVGGTFVCMGNPHLVLFPGGVESLPIEKVGPSLEHHSLFPQRVNVEFAELTAPDTIRMRVWERGSGVTRACGTGACATAVAAILTGRVGRRVRVCMDGGELEIEWNETDGKIYMTGPAVSVFDGVIEAEGHD